MSSNGDDRNVVARGARIDRDDLDVWELIRRRAGWVFFFGSLGGLAGCIYGLFAKPVYEVKAEVVVIRKTPNLPARAATTSTDIESDVSSNLLATHVEILRSTKIVETGLQQHGLEGLKSIADNKYSFETPADYVIRKMVVAKGGVESVDATANTLRISLKHKSSAEDTQQILSAVIESYINFVAATFQDVSTEAVELISKAKSDLEGDLKATEAEYIQFLRDAPIYWSGELAASGDKRQSIPQRRLELVEEKLADVRLRYVETSTKLEVIEQALNASENGSSNGEYALALLDAQALQRLNFFADIVRGDPTRSEAFQVDQSLRQQEIRAEYEKQLGLLLESESAGMKYGKNHWKTQELERQKSVVKDFLNKHAPSSRDLKDSVPASDVLAAYVQMLRNDSLDLKKRKDELEALAKGDISAAKELVNFEVRGELLRQELDRRRKLHDAVIDRLREMNLMRDYGGVLTELIRPVEIGKLSWLGLIQVSSWFAVLLSIIAGGIVGVSGGIVFGVFRHVIDSTFGGDRDVERVLSVPVVGHVDQDRISIVEALRKSKSGINTAVTVFSQPDSVSANAYRQARNALLLLRSRKDFKVVQISGATSKDGQALLAANLAAALAQLGQKILLVDCELQNRVASRLCGVTEQSASGGTLPNNSIWKNWLHSTEIPGLSVLIPDQAVNGSSDSLFTQEFHGLMTAARKEFDIVIMVTPEILGRPESMALAGYCDRVLLSLRVARGARGAAILATDNLVKLGVPIAGVIITGADSQSYFGYYDLRQALKELKKGQAVKLAY